MTKTEHASHLRNLYAASVRARRESAIAGQRYSLAVEEALQALGAPLGFMLDIHGDGELKPEKDCAAPKPLP